MKRCNLACEICMVALHIHIYW